MTPPADIVRRDTALGDGPAAAAAALESALAELAGAAAPVSLTLDYGRPGAAGEPVTAEAWVERSTRTLVFAHGRLIAAGDGALIASGSAVFRRAAESA